MHVFVSDLHLAESPAGDPVSDAELVAFVDELAYRATSGPATLVLLGDVIDLLRSPRWDELWRSHRAAPWSAMAAEFANFPGSHAEACALEVLRGVAARYRRLAAALRVLVSDGRLAVVYVTGNHDFMLHLSAPLRREAARLLSLAHDPERPFPTVYRDAHASVYATHGHAFDGVNHHRVPEGLWAFGDAVVLRLVNRFQTAACEALGCSPETRLGRRLADLDNVAPLADVPVYVRWLAEELTLESERRRLLAVWRRVVEELLALPEFRDGGYGCPEIAATRAGLRLSTELGLAELAARCRRFVPDLERDYSRDAAAIAASAPYRFVVFGHTHDPMMVPLPVAAASGPAFYVNTGSWRRVVRRPRGAAGPFVGVRMGGRFVVEGGRYRLLREWHAS